MEIFKQNESYFSKSEKMTIERKKAEEILSLFPLKKRYGHSMELIYKIIMPTVDEPDVIFWNEVSKEIAKIELGYYNNIDMLDY